jgi:hypothetical protein
MSDIIDLREWREELKLNAYEREEANALVLAYVLKTNLYLMGEASGIERNKTIMGNIVHELEGAIEMAKELGKIEDE